MKTKKPKAIYLGILLSIISVLSSHAQHDDFPILEGPWLRQKPPGSTSEIFTSGIISSQENVVCDYTSLIQKYQSEIREKMKSLKVQGLSIALIDEDSVVWTEGLGYADKQHSIKATSTTKYLIGSVTKLFTAIGVMQLQELNKLSIDDPLQRHLPQFNIKSHYGDINNITIRSVMTHHGGIPSDIFTNFVGENPRFTTTVDYINLEYATYPPGLIKSYSNAGYTLLGHMIQEVAREPFTDYIVNHIFNPLGMSQSGFFVSKASSEDLSKSYNKEGTPDKEFPPRDVPAGGIFSSASDMAMFAVSLLKDNNEIVSKESLHTMLEQQNKDIKLDLDDEFGLCWTLIDSKAGLIAYHSGASNNHRAMFAIAPESKLGIVILSNSVNGGGIGSLCRKILEYAAKIKDVESDIKKTYPKYPNYKKINKIKVADKVLLKETGHYAAPGMSFIIGVRNHKLSSKIQGARFNLIPLDNGKYLPQINFLGIINKRLRKERFYFDDVNGHHILVQEHMISGSKSIVGDRIEPSRITGKWKKRLGDYSLINNISTMDYDIFSDISLEIKNDFMVFCLTINPERQKMEFPLRLIDENEGQMMGIGRYGGGVLQFTINDNGEDTLLIYGLQMKKQ